MKYLKHLPKFDSRHLMLLREMLFERLTWDEEIDEDREILKAIEVLMDERGSVDVSPAREGKELKFLIDDIVLKTLDGSFGKEDIPNNTNYSMGTIALLVAERLGLAVANAVSKDRQFSDLYSQKNAEEVLSNIINSLEGANAPESWMLLTIHCIAKDHYISFTQFQHMPEFRILVNKYRKPLRSLV